MRGSDSTGEIMIKKNLASLIIALSLACMSSAHADAAEDRETFQAIFSAWTQSFNEKRFPEVCNLFSRSLSADYQGARTKDYAGICNGFKTIFQEKDVIYHNDFKIHQIVRANDLAAVRITWYLNVYKEGAHVSAIQEEGLDVFQRQANGNWEIVNFIAYPVLPEKQ
jgi:ketosteroid isomerase-like protein